MQITHRKEGQVDIFCLEGRFDAHCAGKVEEELNSAISKEARKLLIDLEGCEYISSAGLRVLLATAKKIKKEEGRIKLCSLQPYVKEVFDVAGFTQIFKIYDTAQKAVESF